MKKLRLFLAALLLAVSVVLLAWASSPLAREERQLHIEPTQMQLPAPQGLVPASLL